jgi:hypothetical protein
MKTYEEYQNEVRRVVFETLDSTETYIVSDVHARLSIYLVDGTEDLKNRLFNPLRTLLRECI